MKLQILPPARIKAGGSYYVLDGEQFLSAWDVVFQVGGGYRYHRSIAAETQKDLLRFCALNSIPVRVGLIEGRRPLCYFERPTVESWLDQGGRAWIIAELEARSGRRVIAFPNGRGHP